jgi:hypothetical protein
MLVALNISGDVPAMSVVPVVGRLLLGNPANYRMLGVYTERFQGCEPVVDAMRSAGFDAVLVSYFHGCATGVVARKPIAQATA